MESKFVAFLLIWVGFAIATAMIAKRKGHVGSTWFALGMIGGNRTVYCDFDQGGGGYPHPRDTC